MIAGSLVVVGKILTLRVPVFLIIFKGKARIEKRLGG